MLIPSIDIQSGRAVQLQQGRTRILDGGDPLEVAERFARVGEIAVIDLDAAMGSGDNRSIIESMLKRFPCRVGGGIRDYETAIGWLDAGATRIILGTAAEPELLERLPRDRVLAAVDAWGDEVVVEGWRTGTGETVADRIARLRPYVSGFLATFVENEGTGKGLDLDRARVLAGLLPDHDLIVAGGTRCESEIASLDRLGIDVQVGRGIYEGSLGLGRTMAAMLNTDRPDGLYPTIVCDRSGAALGLVYSSERSLDRTIETGKAFYESRRRGLWEKGASSGAVQRVLRIDLDCDRDALRFTVEQEKDGFCHLDRWTCWDDGSGVERLERRLRRLAGSDSPKVEGSYTQRLLSDPTMIRGKILEEAAEFVADDADVVHEAADLLYFTITSLVQRGVSWNEVVDELDRRALRSTRRGGEVKAVDRIREMAR